MYRAVRGSFGSQEHRGENDKNYDFERIYAIFYFLSWQGVNFKVGAFLKKFSVFYVPRNCSVSLETFILQFPLL